MYIILTYDISIEDNGAKILRNVFKICKKYLYHVQFSVFEGEISPSQFTALSIERQSIVIVFMTSGASQFTALSIELKKWIRPASDSVIIFQTRQEKWLKKDFIGKKEDATSNIL